MEWWVWTIGLIGVIIVLAVGIALWARWDRRHGTPDLPSPVTTAGEADDLAVIEGIGPRIHDVLHDAGISTFARLAATEVAELQRILTDAELPPTHPDTWPAQARLAADGRWDELKSLQDSLRGGRAT